MNEYTTGNFDKFYEGKGRAMRMQIYYNVRGFYV